MAYPSSVLHQAVSVTSEPFGQEYPSPVGILILDANHYALNVQHSMFDTGYYVVYGFEYNSRFENENAVCILFHRLRNTRRPSLFSTWNGVRKMLRA